jgi:uncharacterized protein YcgI (DUF1989 family)
LGEERGLEVTAINPFMNILHHLESRMEIVEPTTRAGDEITIEVLPDVYVGSSNRPEEHNPCGAFHVSPISGSSRDAGPGVLTTPGGRADLPPGVRAPPGETPSHLRLTGRSDSP